MSMLFLFNHTEFLMCSKKPLCEVRNGNQGKGKHSFTLSTNTQWSSSQRPAIMLGKLVNFFIFFCLISGEDHDE